MKLRNPCALGLHVVEELRRIYWLLLRWHPVAVPHAGLVVVALVGDDFCRFFDRNHLKLIMSRTVAQLIKYFEKPK